MYLCVCACVRVCLQVLATDSNPGIEYEYWLPPDRYALYHGRRSPLREPYHTASYLPWNQPPTPSITTTTTTTTTTTVPRHPPPPSIRPKWGKPVFGTHLLIFFFFFFVVMAVTLIKIELTNVLNK